MKKSKAEEISGIPASKMFGAESLFFQFAV
jgi:hypothetical protein